MRHGLLALLLIATTAMADRVEWTTGEAWEDVTVHEIVVDGTQVKAKVARDDAPAWYSGIRGITLRRDAFQIPTAESEAQLHDLKQRRVPILKVHGQNYYRVGNDYYTEHGLRDALRAPAAIAPRPTQPRPPAPPQTQPDPTPTPANSELRDAYANAKLFTGERLKAPSTAQWAPFDPWAIMEYASNNYHVYSYVDAENVYGGTRRLYYFADLRRIDRDDWILKEWAETDAETNRLFREERKQLGY